MWVGVGDTVGGTVGGSVRVDRTPPGHPVGIRVGIRVSVRIRVIWLGLIYSPCCRNLENDPVLSYPWGITLSPSPSNDRPHVLVPQPLLTLTPTMMDLIMS